jgi:pectate lyase
VNGKPTDILAAYNAANPTQQLSGTVDWTPQYHLRIDPTPAIPAIMRLFAGPSS